MELRHVWGCHREPVVKRGEEATMGPGQARKVGLDHLPRPGARDRSTSR